MLNFCSSERISLSACSSWAHFSLCPCNVNFIRTRCVFETEAFKWAGFESLHCFTFLALSPHVAYVVHTEHVTSPPWIMSKHPLALQKPLFGNFFCSSSSSLTESWLIGKTWWRSLRDSSNVLHHTAGSSLVLWLNLTKSHSLLIVGTLDIKDGHPLNRAIRQSARVVELAS